MDISELLSSLTDTDIEQLKQTASALLGSFGGGAEHAEAREDAQHEWRHEAREHSGDIGLDTNIIKALTGINGMMKRPDPRCDFLLALGPLLHESRRDRVDQAAKMLRLLNVLPSLNGIIK